MGKEMQLWTYKTKVVITGKKTQWIKIGVGGMRISHLQTSSDI